MGDTKRRSKNTQIDTKSKVLLDTETGEITEIRNANLYKNVTTNEIEITYKEYVYLDVEKLGILIKDGIKPVDLAMLVGLSAKLLVKTNVCMKNEKEPHDTTSIAELFNETVQSSKKKINRLIELGLLWYGKSENDKRGEKVYIMNPHIIKKGRYHSLSIGKLFNDIEKKDATVVDKLIAKP